MIVVGENNGYKMAATSNNGCDSQGIESVSWLWATGRCCWRSDARTTLHTSCSRLFFLNEKKIQLLSVIMLIDTGDKVPKGDKQLMLI